MAGITFDDSDFIRGTEKLLNAVDRVSRDAVQDIANEVLRLSQQEVPHDTGSLQNSGHIEEEKDGFVVGYNKVYAAKLHENPQFSFQKKRKGKYLEDPVKNNLKVFQDFYKKRLSTIM